jgi:hypothetical protein
MNQPLDPRDFMLLPDRPNWNTDELPMIQGQPVGAGTPAAPPAIDYRGGGGGGADPYSMPSMASSGMPGVGEALPMTPPQSRPPVDPALLDQIRSMRKDLVGRSQRSVLGLRSPAALQASQQAQGLIELENELTNPNSRTALHARQVAVQEQAATLDWAKSAVGLMENFAGLDSETKANLAPVYGNVFRQAFKSRGIDVPESLFRAMADQPGAAEAALDIFMTDKAYTADERKQYLSAIRKMKVPEAQAYLTKIQADKVASMQARIVPMLGDIVAKVKATEGIPADQPLAPELLLKYATEHPLFTTSPTFQRVVTDVLSGKSGEDILTNVGVLAPSVRRQQLIDAAKSRSEAGMNEDAAQTLAAKWRKEQPSYPVTIAQDTKGGFRVTQHPPAASMQGDQLAPDALDTAAEFYNQTGTLPQGLSRNPQTSRLIMNRAAQLRGGMPANLAESAAGYKADAKSLAELEAQRGKILAFEHTAGLNADLALELSAQVNRGQAPVLNRWVLAGRRSVKGDANIVAFDAAVNTFANEYAKVVSSATGGGVTSDSARHEAMSLINTAQTPEQFSAAIATLKKDMANRRAGYDSQRAEIADRIRTRGVSPTQQQPAQPSPAEKAPEVKEIAPRVKVRRVR